MLVEPADDCLSGKAGQAPRKTRARRTAKPAVVEIDLKIVDAAFADLETTTLRRDNPTRQPVAGDALPPYQGVVQQLAFQLLVLDEQRQHLAKLLQDLQTSIPAEG